MQIVPCKVIQESTIRLLIALQSGIHTAESKIQTSEESGILILGQVSGIRNPRPIWNPESKWWNPESKERNPESKERNPESKKCNLEIQGVHESGIQGVHGLPYMGQHEPCRIQERHGGPI